MTHMTATSTPPFLAWALAQSCPLRNIERWPEPERTERHLRAIVEYAKGASDERVIDGVCLCPECLQTATSDKDCTGFLVDEALAMFGGLTAVEECCAACPANVMQPFMSSLPLAGCHGLLPLPNCDRWEEVARRGWYQQCAKSPWQSGRVDALQVFSLVAGQGEAPQREQLHFSAALDVCLQQAIPLHVRMFPAGRIEKRRWILPQMCVACGAPWEEKQAACRWCESTTATGGEMKRHIRGHRPFQPLSRFLPHEEAERILGELRGAKEDQKAAARQRYQESLGTAIR
jgi:hypothetical protein